MNMSILLLQYGKSLLNNKAHVVSRITKVSMIKIDAGEASRFLDVRLRSAFTPAYCVTLIRTLRDETRVLD